jgi:hypothetical protein
MTCPLNQTVIVEFRDEFGTFFDSPILSHL